MQLVDFQHAAKKINLGITEGFGRILTLVDFGNVDYWFESDRFDENGVILQDGEKLNIDLQKLNDFCRLFSTKTKFYYGLDHKKKWSIHIIKLARDYFGRSNVETKDIQYIRHYLNASEIPSNTRSVTFDIQGQYIQIPKCNFDVEISIDAIRLIDQYDTLCLFSGDADFVSLFRFVKDRGKQVILIKGGHVLSKLIELSDLVINAQDIKKELVFIKQKSRR
jgi:uncharacterized LabA/DUF88 family protein